MTPLLETKIKMPVRTVADTIPASDPRMSLTLADMKLLVPEPAEKVQAPLVHSVA